MIEENQQYAIWKVHSPELFHGGEVQELMKNGRAMLKSENKKGPVVYYHRLCSIKEGKNIIAQIRSLKEQVDKVVLDVYDGYKSNVDKLINPIDNDSKF